jgi:hypothetical protein
MSPYMYASANPMSDSAARRRKKLLLFTTISAFGSQESGRGTERALEDTEDTSGKLYVVEGVSRDKLPYVIPCSVLSTIPLLSEPDLWTKKSVLT